VTRDESDGSEHIGGTVVLLAGPGDTTDIVANFLAKRVPHLEVIVEEAPSRIRMARRRARRVGWSKVVGQVLFVAVALPLLRWRGKARIAAILASTGLDPTPYPAKSLVSSVNEPATVDLLRAKRPTVIVVNGTRIISSSVLDAVDCPFINTHAGITPRYRGVHGGYWALAEGKPQLVGTTVHLVDPGIDTGGVLARTTFDTSPTDTMATYPYLHLAAGLPQLAEQVDRALAEQDLDPIVEDAVPEDSRLYLHPTLWEYLCKRIGSGVR
jgi:phosphoribosylglycinamide formyltransferase-1